MITEAGGKVTDFQGKPSISTRRDSCFQWVDPPGDASDDLGDRRENRESRGCGGKGVSKSQPSGCAVRLLATMNLKKQASLFNKRRRRSIEKRGSSC